MSLRVQNILAKARVTLADQDKQRWSDDVLLAFLSEAQQDLATETQLLAGRVSLPIEINNPYFTLPDDVWLITRILYGEKRLPLVSHTELDTRQTVYRLRDFGLQPSDTWESDKGMPEAFLYDRRNQNEGKLYKIPDESVVTSTYPFTDQGGYAGDGALGLVTDIEGYTTDTVFGVVTDTYDPLVTEEFYNSVFGVVGSMSENENNLLIYYVKLPEDITDINAELQTSPQWDKALKYYVIGHAFLADIDAEYQSKGMEQLQLYERELLKAKKTEQRDGTRAGEFRTDYRRVI